MPHRVRPATQAIGGSSHKRDPAFACSPSVAVSAGECSALATGPPPLPGVGGARSASAAGRVATVLIAATTTGFRACPGWPPVPLSMMRSFEVASSRAASCASMASGPLLPVCAALSATTVMMVGAACGALWPGFAVPLLLPAPPGCCALLTLPECWSRRAMASVAGVLGSVGVSNARCVTAPAAVGAGGDPPSRFAMPRNSSLQRRDARP
jgi:hypothetical protein